MNASELIPIGTFRRTHGYRGQLRLALDENIKELLSPEALFIFRNDRPLPYFVEALESAGDTLLVKLESVESKEAAAALRGETAFVRPDAVHLMEATRSQSWIGFMIVDQDGHEIGLLDDILDLPGQRLGSVVYQGREVLIPIVEQQVLAVDPNAKTLQINIPDGLLEL